MCNREAPSVEEAAKRWAGTVDFVGVAWTGSDSSFQSFIDKHGLTFPTISDDGGAVFTHFEVPSQPALVMVSPDGSERKILGAVEADELDAIVNDAIAG